MKYFLTTYHINDNQEVFAKSLANEIRSITSGQQVKYLFGNEVYFFTFDSQTPFKQLSSFFETILGELSIQYVLIPFKSDKMSFWFEKEQEKHLFGTDICVTNEEFSEEEQREIQDTMFGTSNNFIEREMRKPEYEEFLNKVIEEALPTPTLDDLLDKINLTGFNSLTTKEKELLKKYSK